MGRRVHLGIASDRASASRLLGYLLHVHRHRVDLCRTEPVGEGGHCVIAVSDLLFYARCIGLEKVEVWTGAARGLRCSEGVASATPCPLKDLGPLC
jgi:hypothetical protein